MLALLVALGVVLAPSLEPRLAAHASRLLAPLHVVRLSLRPAPDALPVPVAGVPPRAIRGSWGAPRDGGRRAHRGIDIFAPRGTPVLATTEGVVWSTRGNRLGGTVVWVLGPGRQLHYYAHLERLAAIAPGDRVRAGDLLGTVGTTGNARGGRPHLHYGVYGADGAIDPYPLLAASR